MFLEGKIQHLISIPALNLLKLTSRKRDMHERKYVKMGMMTMTQPEVGKAQLKAQPPQLRKLRCALIFYFETLRKLRCGIKPLKFVAL